VGLKNPFGLGVGVMEVRIQIKDYARLKHSHGTGDLQEAMIAWAVFHFLAESYLFIGIHGL